MMLPHPPAAVAMSWPVPGVWPVPTGESRFDQHPREWTEQIVPVGKGIYEDEPREHRHTYQPGSDGSDGSDTPKGQDTSGQDPAPDDTSTDNAPEPSG